MKKEYRVKSEKDFQRVFQEGKSVANRQFVVYSLPKEANEHFRVGLSVSKRLGNAVKRNQIKRRIRHALQSLDQEWGIQPQNDLIVIARQPVSQMSFAEIYSSLTHVLKLADLFIQTPEKKVSTKPEI